MANRGSRVDLRDIHSNFKISLSPSNLRRLQSREVSDWINICMVQRAVAHSKWLYKHGATVNPLSPPKKINLDEMRVLVFRFLELWTPCKCNPQADGPPDCPQHPYHKGRKTNVVHCVYDLNVACFVDADKNCIHASLADLGIKIQ